MSSGVRLTEELGAVELSDPEGRPVRLGPFWEQQPVVLVFVRHFG